MNVKFYCICIIILIVSLSIKAQYSIGLDGGYSYNHLNTKISNRGFTNNKNESGFNADMQINYDLYNFLRLNTGISLTQKNYSLVRDGEYLGEYETFTNTYFQIPVTIQLEIFKIKEFEFSIKTGLYGAYWAFAKVNGAIPNIFSSTDIVGNNGQIVQYLSFVKYSEKYQFNKTKDNRFEFGLKTGIGINYPFHKKYSLLAEFNYVQSITDQQKRYMVNQTQKFNETFSISVGCLIKLTNKKK
ncbi:MAG TPA: porin family protein [Bacteroidales bacterium]